MEVMKHLEVNCGTCIKCGKKVEDSCIDLDDGYKCGCGSNVIILGDNFSLCNNDNGILCVCLNNKFKRVMHIDFSTYSKNVYECDFCGNSITLDIYLR